MWKLFTDAVCKLCPTPRSNRTAAPQYGCGRNLETVAAPPPLNDGKHVLGSLRSTEAIEGSTYKVHLPRNLQAKQMEENIAFATHTVAFATHTI